MAKKVKTWQLADEIIHLAAVYPDHIMQRVTQIADEEIKKVHAAIKADAPIGARGQYVRKMKTRTIQESFEERKAIWHVEKPDYRLSHLLENGHQKVNGGRTRAFPHIKKHEEEVADRFYKRVSEVIKNEPPRD